MKMSGYLSKFSPICPGVARFWLVPLGASLRRRRPLWGAEGGGGISGSQPREQGLPLKKHDQVPIKMLMHTHLGTGKMAARPRRQELYAAAVVADRVIQGHRALLVQAETLREHQLSRNVLPSQLGFCRRDRKTGVKTGEILLQDGIGLLQVTGPHEAQFAHQPILKGAPEPLNASFGLRRASCNGRDGQLPEQPAQLGRASFSL